MTTCRYCGSYTSGDYPLCGSYTCAMQDNAPDSNPEPEYTIIRFRANGNNEAIAAGLTLAEAQAHCHRDDTHGEGWFDGYRDFSAVIDTQKSTPCDSCGDEVFINTITFGAGPGAPRYCKECRS